MWVELIIFFILLAVFHYYYNRPRNMPPGSMVIPYLGSALAMDYTMVRKYRKKYGDIFRTEMGPNKFIFLCNYNLIKDVLSRPEFSDRPNIEISLFFSDGVPLGVINSNGQHWQNARRFLLRNLRDLGMGKTYLEEAIQKEASMLVEDMKKRCDTPTLFPKAINVAILNVVWQMVASTRYEPDDERVLAVINIIRSFEISNLLAFIEFIPIVKMMIPDFLKKKISMYKTLEKLKVEGRTFMKDMITSHRAKLDPDNPRDVIDEYIVAMDNKTDIAKHFSELDLMCVIFDLFNAGFDTTSNMLRWVILYMARHPEVQRRIQQQIDEVVPSDTLPSFQHKQNLPLVEALVHEALRFASLIGIGVQRTCTRDTTVGGYLIPKGSFVFGASLCCHEDPQYWEQPDQFRLEHFLNEENKFVAQKEGFVPFGTGRRSCLGESLARMELFLFSSALLQNFTFSAPEGCTVNLDQNPRLPSVNMTIDQNIVITQRTKKVK